MSNPQQAPRSERTERPPRRRSAFAAAFLSLLFPGLGHAYAGAFGRALAFAALPLLGVALGGGIAIRADRTDLLAFFAQEDVLRGLFAVNVVLLIYRIVAAADAWNVARFLNAADLARTEAGAGRVARDRGVRSPLSLVSIAGLLAVILVMAGAHLAVARYNALALDLVHCVFSEDEDAACSDESPAPSITAGGETLEPSGSKNPGASPTDALPSPEGSAATGTPAPTLPPWDGKERLNVLLVGSDARPGETSFNTDTMIVVSVEPSTGEVAMFQVPRDMADVPVPASARAVWGSVYRGKINSWFTQNRHRGDLWPGNSDNARGFAALKGLLGELYGLKINYYALVNFDGFRKVVNALGGVNINVQIPVTESQYPVAGGLTRLYIPAGPQHMTGREALVYARSRHRSQYGDFDRGRRQQRVLISLREQMNAQAIVANLPKLVAALKESVKTDIKTRDLPKLLALAESVDTKNIRSFVFSPTYYATEFQNSDRGYIITPNVSRIRRAVDQAFKVTPTLLARREQLEEEAATVWVVNGSGRAGLETTTASFLEYQGITASAPRKQTQQRPATSEIVVYNGAEAELGKTIAYLERRFKTTVTTATDPKVTVDIVVTLGRDAPDLDVDAVG